MTQQPRSSHFLEASLPQGALHPQRLTGVAQSALLDRCGQHLALWTLATDLDAAFIAGEHLHVTIADSSGQTVSFASDNASYLLRYAGEELILEPDASYGVILKKFTRPDHPQNATLVTCLFLHGEQFIQMDPDAYLNAMNGPRPEERFVTYADIISDSGQAAAATAQQAQAPLELLRSLYPSAQYPDAIHPELTEPQRRPSPQGHTPPREQRRSPADTNSGAWKLARLIDQAYQAGRTLTVSVHSAGQILMLTNADAGHVLDLFAGLLERNENADVHALISETQQEDVICFGQRHALSRVSHVQATGSRILDLPYADPEHWLRPNCLITPLRTLLPESPPTMQA